MKKNNKKIKSKVNIISYSIFSIMILLSVITFGIVIKLGVLPTKYLTLILITYTIMCLLFGLLIFKKKIRKWVKIVIDIFCIFIIFVLGFGLNYLNQTLNFMDKITAGEYQDEEYYVLVLDDSNYESITDLEDQLLGTYTDLSNTYDEALLKTKNEINLDTKNYSSYIEAGHALIDGDVEAIFISSAHKSILDDLIADFDSKVRSIYNIILSVENNIEVKEADVTNESFNIYISGIDTYGDISSVSRSDVNMVVTVNPKTNEVLLTSIPRDYYVKLHGTTGYKDKLTHAGIYGINMSIQTIEDLLDIDINYYVRVNFTTLISLVDSIGGISIYSDKEFTAYTNKNCTFKLGNNTVNGDCALAFARERFAYETGDRHRVQNQQDVLKSILKKALSSTTLITKYSNILKTLERSFETNIPSTEIYNLINMQLDEMPSWNISNYSLNGSDSHNYTYSYNASTLYVMEPDYTTVTEGQKKIKAILNGE
ncbi:MAG: LCP family protein [Bacilli bacterium]